MRFRRLIFHLLSMYFLSSCIESSKTRLKFYDPKASSILYADFPVLFVRKFAEIKTDRFFRNVSVLSDDQCNRDVHKILTGYQMNEQWAKLMIDAQPKKPSKLLKFNRFNFGNMEECLNIIPPDHYLTTKFCSVFINDTHYPYIGPRFNIRRMRTPFYYTGICVPTSCSIDYMNKAFEEIAISKTNRTYSDYVEIKIDQGDCVNREDPNEFSMLNYATMTIFGCLLAIVLLSTVADCFCGSMSEAGSFYRKYPAQFSLMRTGPSLLKSYLNKNSGSTNTILGMKAVCSIYIAVTHVAYIQQNGVVDSFYLEDLLTLGRQIEGRLLIFNAYSAVDIFLAISGILVVFSFYREVKQKGSYDPLLNIIKRHLRLNLTVSAIYLFYSGIVDKLGYGPMFKPLCRYFQSYCTGYDFSSLLLGFYNFRTLYFTCFPHAWYVTMDLQLFVVSQLILIVALRSSRGALLLTLVFGLAGIATEFGVAYVNKMGIILNYDTSKTMCDREYTLPHTRCVPWFLGMALGFLLIQWKMSKHNISMKCRIIGWMLYVVNMWASVVPIMYFSNEYKHPLVSALYLCYRRIGWTFIAAWPIFTSHLGYSNIISAALSWKPLLFIGTISFELYLVHYVLIEYMIALGTETFFLSYERIVYYSFPVLIYGIVLSAAIYLMVTLPFSKIITNMLRNVHMLNVKARK